MAHNTLENYYLTIFTLVHNRKFTSIEDIENLIPFERDVYLKLMKADDERKADELRQQEHVERLRSERARL